MTGCPSSAQLQQLLADRVAGPESEAVEAHVETCARCQQALEQLTRSPDASRGGGPLSRGQSGGDFLRRLEKEPPGPGAFPHDSQQARTTSTADADPNRTLPGEPTISHRA